MEYFKLVRGHVLTVFNPKGDNSVGYCHEAILKISVPDSSGLREIMATADRANPAEAIVGALAKALHEAYPLLGLDKIILTKQIIAPNKRGFPAAVAFITTEVNGRSCDTGEEGVCVIEAMWKAISINFILQIEQAPRPRTPV